MAGPLSAPGPAGPAPGPAAPRALAVGLVVPQFRERPDDALAALDDALRLGLDGAFLFDHLWPLGQPGRPALEAWTMLAALAARVGVAPGAPGAAPGARPFRVGTLVTRAGLRPPALVAHMAATVGRVAGSPPIVGIGIGDTSNRDENEAFGLPYDPDPDARAAVLERTVAALRAQPGSEVWVGGNGRRARGLAGRVGDAWSGWALTSDELAAGLTGVHRAAADLGREPGAVAATWGGQVLLAEGAAEARARLARWADGRPPAEVARVVTGDPEAVGARLAQLRDAGATWCVAALVGGPGATLRPLLAAAADAAARYHREPGPTG